LQLDLLCFDPCPNLVHTPAQAKQFRLRKRTGLVQGENLGTEGVDGLRLLGLQILDLLFHGSDLALPIGLGHALPQPRHGRLHTPPFIHFGNDLTGTLDDLVDQLAHLIILPFPYTRSAVDRFGRAARVSDGHVA
jgi:hypothetical protein